MTDKFSITHLYPKHMSLYGDRGNAQVLSFIAKQFGIDCETKNCSVGERIDKDVNVILLGGGQDNDQENILKDLLSRRSELEDLISKGAVFLGVCGGYQLLGEYYESAVGNYLDGLKLIDIHTKNAKKSEKRTIGNVTAKSDYFGMLFGFENHGGRTFLGDNVNPLAKVIQGGGNNGQDKTEGVYQSFGKGLILGTYFHSFLPKNTHVAESLIRRSVKVDNKKTKNNRILENMNIHTSLNLDY